EGPPDRAAEPLAGDLDGELVPPADEHLHVLRGADGDLRAGRRRRGRAGELPERFGEGERPEQPADGPVEAEQGGLREAGEELRGGHGETPGASPPVATGGLGGGWACLNTSGRTPRSSGPSGPRRSRGRTTGRR